MHANLGRSHTAAVPGVAPALGPGPRTAGEVARGAPQHDLREAQAVQDLGRARLRARGADFLRAGGWVMRRAACRHPGMPDALALDTEAPVRLRCGVLSLTTGVDVYILVRQRASSVPSLQFFCD